MYFTILFLQNWHKTVNLNKAVLRSGFGKVTDLSELSNKRLAVKLTQELLKVELAAEKAHQGVWNEETRLERWKGVMSTSWNGTVFVVKGIVGVGAKIARAPLVGYKMVRQFISKVKNR